jgi:hypothetical protein
MMGVAMVVEAKGREVHADSRRDHCQPGEGPLSPPFARTKRPHPQGRPMERTGPDGQELQGQALPSLARPWSTRSTWSDQSCGRKILQG